MKTDRLNGLDRLLTNEEMDIEISKQENGEPSILDAVVNRQNQESIRSWYQHRITPQSIAAFLKKTGCD